MDRESGVSSRALGARRRAAFIALRRLPLVRMLQRNVRALRISLRSADLLRAVAFAVIGWLLALIVCWEFDLRGWRRDLLRSLPIALLIPWAIAARRRSHRQLDTEVQRGSDATPPQTR